MLMAHVGARKGYFSSNCLPTCTTTHSYLLGQASSY